VSRGPGNRDFLMPDLIGRPASTVLETLRTAGLKVAEVRYRAYPGAAAGLVLRQAPLAGHRVSPQTSISLDVSQSGQ
jgi:beta-lactam-binding protein with PASTA domain